MSIFSQNCDNKNSADCSSQLSGLSPQRGILVGYFVAQDGIVAEACSLQQRCHGRRVSLSYTSPLQGEVSLRPVANASYCDHVIFRQHELIPPPPQQYNINTTTTDVTHKKEGM